MDPLPGSTTAVHQGQQTWELYWRDRNLRFHAYNRVGPSANIDELLAEVDRDPTCIFWG